MAQAEPRLDVDGAQTKTSTEPRVFDAPTDGEVLTLVGVGVVDEQHDTKAKIGETAANGAVPDSGSGVTGQAVPDEVAEQAETYDTIEKVCPQLFDPAYILEMLSREDVQRDLAVLHESLSQIDLSDCDEDQWRL